MGRPKLALPVAGRSVLECVLDTLRQAGIDDILVVVGPEGDEFISLAKRGGAHVLQLDEDTPDMQATVLAGLCWLERHFQPTAEDDWLLLPADHPSLDYRVIGELLRARADNPAYSVFVPIYEGRRGHPALVGWRHVADLKEFAAGQGLNCFFRRQASRVKECPVAAPGALLDLDTPEDYQRLLELERNHFSEM